MPCRSTSFQKATSFLKYRRSALRERSQVAGRTRSRRAFRGRRSWRLLARLGRGLTETGHEVEGVGQHQGAVVVPIVADEPVGDRGLRRDGLRAPDGRPSFPSTVNSRDTKCPICPPCRYGWARSCIEPLDGVLGVAAFVDVCGLGLVGQVRPHVDEFALRQVPPAYVLVGENVALLDKQRRGAQLAAVLVRAVRPDAVGRARQQDRIAGRFVLGAYTAVKSRLPSRMGMRYSYLV